MLAQFGNHLFADHLWDAISKGTPHVLDDHVLLEEETEWEHFKEDAGSNRHRSLLSPFLRSSVLRVTLKGEFFSYLINLFI